MLEAAIKRMQREQEQRDADFKDEVFMLYVQALQIRNMIGNVLSGESPSWSSTNGTPTCSNRQRRKPNGKPSPARCIWTNGRRLLHVLMHDSEKHTERR